MVKILLRKLYNFMSILAEYHAFHVCISNAYKGFPNSQLEIAEYYLYKKQDYLEAYAWEDVASCHHQNRIHNAEMIKKETLAMLKPEQVKEAWDIARDYKKHFLPRF